MNFIDHCETTHYVEEEYKEQTDEQEGEQEEEITYNGLKLLTKNNISENDIQINDIYFVPYHIQKKNNPFIQILLCKDSDKIQFLQKRKDTNSINVNNVFSNVLMTKLNEDSNKGYKIYDNKLYIFFDISDINIDYFGLSENSSLFFCTYTEIINEEKTCNISIDYSVTHFFIKHIDFLELSNPKTNIVYDYPTILYSGNTLIKVKFENMFGRIPNENNNFYYFTELKQALQQSHIEMKDDINLQKCYVARFAVFLKKFYHGADTKWYEIYDTLYIKDANEYVIKNYENHCPLTYHTLPI